MKKVDAEAEEITRLLIFRLTSATSGMNTSAVAQKTSAGTEDYCIKFTWTGIKLTGRTWIQLISLMKDMDSVNISYEGSENSDYIYISNEGKGLN